MKQIVTDPKSPLFDEAAYAMMCKDKKVYTSPWDANYAIEMAKSRNPKLKLSFYRCDFCHNFHLTSN